MPVKPENQFITSIHKHLCPPSQLYRMKNHNAYVGGIPDVWYSGPKSDLWIEYKFIKSRNPRNQVVPDLSKLQLRWITGRNRDGRSVWVVIGNPDGGVILTDVQEMQDGISAFEFLDRLKSRKELALTIQQFCTGEINGDSS